MMTGSEIRLRKMPVQKPGLSKQDYSTPHEFIEAVRSRFNIRRFEYDLAATAGNSKGCLYFDANQNGLAQNWSRLKGDLWLNPPFGDIGSWAEKCSEYKGSGRIFFLTPASVGANWFNRYVWTSAAVYALNGRLSFDGKAPFPKDCMLSVFERKPVTKFEVWRWR